MARSDMIHISMWVDSGISDTKSQKLSCAVCACGKPRSGSCLAAWIDVGELDRVLDEEHRDVVADQVPVALPGVELRRRSRGRRGPGRPSPCCRRRWRTARTPGCAGPPRRTGRPGSGRSAARSSRRSRAPRSRGRGPPARGSARGRSGRSSPGNGSPPARPGRARRPAACSGRRRPACPAGWSAPGGRRGDLVGFAAAWRHGLGRTCHGCASRLCCCGVGGCGGTSGRIARRCARRRRADLPASDWSSDCRR